MPNLRFVTLLTALTASTLAAQAQPEQPSRSMGRIPAAQLLLAHTGELQLTDQQVVRLAAIARRAETRRRAMRASVDSVRSRFVPGQADRGDSVARRQLRERMRADMDRVRDQASADQRDAIAVLTADQQARAWDLASSRGRNRGAMRERNMRRGPGRGGFRSGLRTPRPPRDR